MLKSDIKSRTAFNKIARGEVATVDDGIEEMAKARQVKYFKREAKPGGGYKYYYTEAQYKKEKGKKAPEKKEGKKEAKVDMKYINNRAKAYVESENGDEEPTSKDLGKLYASMPEKQVRAVGKDKIKAAFLEAVKKEQGGGKEGKEEGEGDTYLEDIGFGEVADSLQEHLNDEDFKKISNDVKKQDSLIEEMMDGDKVIDGWMDRHGDISSLDAFVDSQLDLEDSLAAVKNPNKNQMKLLKVAADINSRLQKVHKQSQEKINAEREKKRKGHSFRRAQKKAKEE